MEIQELYLKHYGRFEDHRIRLEPGVNIIYGRNETGKTTIHSFIRAMFFGLARGRGRASRTDEYSLRSPWENPAYFAGSMTVAEGEETFQIDRNFDREHQSCTVVNRTRAAQAEDGSAEIGRLLGGMSGEAFDNTIFIRQARAETGDALMEELRAFLVNCGRPAGPQTDVSRALQSLQKKKKQLVQKKKAEEALLEEQIGRRQAEADYIRREIDALREREKNIAETPPGRTEPEEEYGEEDSVREEENRKYRIAAELLLAVSALLAFAGAWLIRMTRVRVFLIVFGLLFLALIFPVRKLLTPASEDDADPGQEEAEDEEIKWRLENVREEIRGHEDKYRKLQGELEKLYQNHVKLEGITIEIEALNLAAGRILSLSSSVFRESGGGLEERASEILARITGGRYTKVSLDDSMEVRVQSRKRLLRLYELSYGTMQQVYFALRVAAGELLAKGRELPLILDEPFAMYDDARLAAVLGWLYDSGRQVILFTCREREQKILEKIKNGTEK